MGYIVSVYKDNGKTKVVDLFLYDYVGYGFDTLQNYFDDRIKYLKNELYPKTSGFIVVFTSVNIA